MPICWFVHRGPLLNKRINEWLALNRATRADFEKYPEKIEEWERKRRWLNKQYGVPDFEGGEAPF